MKIQVILNHTWTSGFVSVWEAESEQQLFVSFENRDGRINSECQICKRAVKAPRNWWVQLNLFYKYISRMHSYIYIATVKSSVKVKTGIPQGTLCTLHLHFSATSSPSSLSHQVVYKCFNMLVTSIYATGPNSSDLETSINNYALVWYQIIAKKRACELTSPIKMPSKGEPAC